MADLSTKYLGIKLKNPVIVGSCNLTADVNNLKRMEKAGAAAVVYKSIFEEQIQLEFLELSEQMEEYAERNAEMVSLFPDMEHAGAEEYVVNLKKAREALTIPLFASINAVSFESWIEYAKKIEETGVNGIEINLYHVPNDPEITGRDIIHEQYDIIRDLKKELKIPVAVKLSQFYTNPLNVITEMDKLGTDGFVLFNRLFQPDIDIDKEEPYFPYNLSNPYDNRLSLRFAGLLYGNINGSICSNTGIFTGEDVITMLLAGADCVQVVSTLYKNHIEQISKILEEMHAWMEGKKYEKVKDFKGKLSRKKTKDPFAYQRAQYIDILMKSETIFKKYPTI